MASDGADVKRIFPDAVLARHTVYGPVRTVVWQGSAGDRRPYANQVAQCCLSQRRRRSCRSFMRWLLVLLRRVGCERTTKEVSDSTGAVCPFGEGGCLIESSPLVAWHPRRTVREFLTHYHGERN